MVPTITSTIAVPVISSTDKIIEEGCLTSKLVQDKYRILIDENDTIDLEKIIAIELKCETSTRDQIYKYFKDQKILSQNEEQVNKAGKTLRFGFKLK